MTAVQAFRERLVTGWPVMALLPGLLTGRAALSGVVAREAVQGGPASRVADMVRRRIAELPVNARVLELVHGGYSRRDLAPETADFMSLRVAADGKRDSVLSSLAALNGEGFDMIFSIDAMGHMRAPWRVADEISRLLRPGGVTFHSCRFSSRYEPSPEDYCRFTPDGLKALFTDLDCMMAEFDSTECPRGSRAAIERRSVFDGSREGWRVHYCGRKRG